MPERLYQVGKNLKQRTTTVNAEQQSSYISGNIRDAIIANNPHAYDSFFGIVGQEDEEKEVTIPLHSQIEKNDSQASHNISFNVAGSSFAQPLRYDLGLAGKTNVWVEGRENNKNETKKYHIRRGDKNIKAYTFTRANNETVKISSEHLSDFADTETEKVFGTGGILGHKDIRRKDSEDGRSTRYSLSGPRISLFGDKNNGTFNAGEYKIENTRDNILKLGKQHINSLLENSNFTTSKEEINFSFTGHSRGGVGAIEGAMLLKGWIKKEHPELLPRIHFNTMLYDPVPGPKTRVTSNINHGCNLKAMTREMEELGMAPFDENDHTTVMYSIGCQHDLGFTPMKVMGADTIIITGHNHDEGLKDTEIQFGQRKPRAYVNAQNGEAYRSQGLTEVPNGVYISDENNVLIKADDMKMVENVIGRVSDLKMDNNRIRRVVEACTDIQVRNGGAPTMDTIVRGFNAHDPRYIRSSKEFKAMRADFEAYHKLMEVPDSDPVKLAELSSKLKKSALDYLSIKEGNGPHSNRTQGRMTVAKDIIRMLDNHREKSIREFTNERLNNSPKTEDTFTAYHDNTLASFRQNTDFMNRLCENYKNHKPVETDMFLQTISGMLADHYFLNHEDAFKNGHSEHLDTVLGNGDNSLYKTFSQSPAVRRFVKDMALGGSFEMFKNPEQLKQCMTALTSMVEKEAVAKTNDNAPQKHETLNKNIVIGSGSQKTQENTIISGSKPYKEKQKKL